ncbi:MAG: hypothetical protein WCO08_06900 [Actinomycetes bacterium]
MKIKTPLVVMVTSLILTLATPAFAADPSPSPTDSPTMSRADTLALIQD